MSIFYLHLCVFQSIPSWTRVVSEYSQYIYKNIHKKNHLFSVPFQPFFFTFYLPTYKYIQNNQGTIMDKDSCLQTMLNFFLDQETSLVSLLGQNKHNNYHCKHVWNKMTFSIDFLVGYILVHSSNLNIWWSSSLPLIENFHFYVKFKFLLD